MAERTDDDHLTAGDEAGQSGDLQDAPGAHVSVARLLMRVVHEGAGLLDAEGRLADLNVRLAQMLGRPAPALNGRPFSSFVGAEFSEEWEATFCSLPQQQEVNVELPVAVSGGRSFEASIALCALCDVPGVSAMLLVSDAPAQRRRVRQLERMLRALEEQRDELEQAVTTDSITGAYSPGAIGEVLRTELAYGRRYRQTVSLLVADIDLFKQVNDTYGHATGDAILQEFCQRCRNAIRTTDYLVRYGGDEFVIILPRTDGTGARAVARRIWDSVRSTVFSVGGKEVEVTVSIGAATADSEAQLTPERLLRRGDDALYQVKRGGRDGVEVWTRDTPSVDGG